jgi:hypothetical protein
MSEFTLLPNARPGMLSGAAVPTATDPLRLSLDFQAQVMADGSAQGAAIGLNAGLVGPGDIIGFDASVISASDPNARSGAFEANYFPYIEFSEVDFPWRYTLDHTANGGRVFPWLTLVALKSDEFETLDIGDGPLPAIRVLSAPDSLPDVSAILYAAHVHIEDPGTSDLAERLANTPQDFKARMLCIRKLEDAQHYTLFLVPSYEQGRLAGLDQSVQASPYDATAWDGFDTSVDLPYYWSKQFVTNSGEDVEALLRRLRAVNAAENDVIGAQDKVFAGAPGYYTDYSLASASFDRQSATNEPGAATSGFATDQDLVRRLDTTLTEAINGEITDETRADLDAGGALEDPLVTFPANGWRFRNERGMNSRRPGLYWFDRVNLDLQFRDAASRGAQVVRKHQDRYMRVAWGQYDGIVKANARLARLQAAERLVVRLINDRFVKLEASVKLTLAEPVLDMVPGQDQNITIRGELDRSGAPLAYTSRGLRRLSAKRARPAAFRSSEASVRSIPAPSIPGDTDEQQVFKIDRSPANIDLQSSEQPALLGRTQSSLQSIFGVAYLKAQIPTTGVVGVGAVDSVLVAAPISTIMTALPKAKAQATIGGRSAQEQRKIAPVWRAPRIDDALADRLRDLDKNALFAGLGALPDNTVTFFEENRAFIEAFLVGANHEMNRELRWRGFPTDMRGTVFQRFWQKGYPAGDDRGNDIDPIHNWTGPLGQNLPAADRDQAENLVMVIKGEIIRKIGLPLVALNIAVTDTWAPDSGRQIDPTFFGQIGDAVYYGFDISRDELVDPTNIDRAFLAIYERPGRIRFGLDIATHQRRSQILSGMKLRAPFALPIAGTGREYARMVPPRFRQAPALNSFETWDDFSWGHVKMRPSGYVDFTSVPQPATGESYWGPDKTSASVARSVMQRPLAAILPLKRVL